ncbi:hypothetical protein K449DRAFT_398577 [Hypoxylon sp. EC38]|nr:hypothetical protein K449DRAFT_398577 [Hypoxylon sp. EC38]
MPHATKKPSRPRLTTVVSTPVQYPQTQTQSSQSSSSSSYPYVWTAADAAKASRDGAFLTPWPRDESYYTPPVHLLGQGYQGYQGQGHDQSQSQGQGGREVQYYYSSTCKPSTTPNQGGSSGGK